MEENPACLTDARETRQMKSEKAMSVDLREAAATLCCVADDIARNLRDAATLNPSAFSQEGIAQLLNKWRSANKAVRELLAAPAVAETLRLERIANDVIDGGTFRRHMIPESRRELKERIVMALADIERAALAAQAPPAKGQEPSYKEELLVIDSLIPRKPNDLRSVYQRVLHEGALRRAAEIVMEVSAITKAFSDYYGIWPFHVQQFVKQRMAVIRALAGPATPAEQPVKGEK
jgi:hypothetical protein